ncbi:hypothetical protein RUND412_008461 [Rhizina undulata]
MSFSYNISDDHMLFDQNMFYSQHDQDAYDYGSDELPVAASYTPNNQTIDPRLLTVDQDAIHSQYQGAEYNPAVERFQRPTPSNIPIQFGQNGLFYSQDDRYAYNNGAADAFQVMHGSSSESLFQVGQENSDISAAQFDPAAASVEPLTNPIKQNRTRIRKPRARVATEKIIRTPRAVARSSNKAGAGVNAGGNAPDRTCSNCDKMHPAKEFGCASRYQKVCRTCREKRAVLGDSRSYCMVCKKFKDIEGFTLGLLSNKNEYPRSCDICRKRDSERKERRKLQRIAIAAATGAAEME